MPRPRIFDDGDFWQFGKPSKSKKLAAVAQLAVQSTNTPASDTAFMSYHILPALKRYNEQSALFQAEKNVIGRRLRARKRAAAAAKVEAALAKADAQNVEAQSSSGFSSGINAVCIPKKESCRFVVYTRKLQDATSGQRRAPRRRRLSNRWRRTMVWLEALRTRSTSARAVLHWSHDDVAGDRRSSSTTAASWEHFAVILHGTQIKKTVLSHAEASELPKSVRDSGSVTSLSVGDNFPIDIVALNNQMTNHLFEALQWAALAEEALRVQFVETPRKTLLATALVELAPQLASFASDGGPTTTDIDEKNEPPGTANNKPSTPLPTSTFSLQVEFAKSRASDRTDKCFGVDGHDDNNFSTTPKFRSKAIRVRGQPSLVAIYPPLKVETEVRCTLIRPMQGTSSVDSCGYGVECSVARGHAGALPSYQASRQGQASCSCSTE